MIKFRNAKSLQKFASIHSSVQNHFNLEHHLSNRKDFELKRETALTECVLLMKFCKFHYSATNARPEGDHPINTFSEISFFMHHKRVGRQ